MGSILQSIEILSKEKGIDAQVVLDAVKDAIVVAARKHFRTTEDLIADIDNSAIQIYGVRKVVESVQDPDREITLEGARKYNPGAEIDAEIRIPKPADVLGRISAQTAKQVILQKVREAERETIHSEFSGRVGELVTCSVKRIEGQDLVVDLGKTEARLPKKEQSKLEGFSVGERVRCVIKSVEKAGKNAGVTVSRGAPELVMRLFEQEVPEIYDSTVVIKGCAREAGERTKIAVMSRDRDVDSVGACVGMKGMRVQSIIRELKGEKIDIIEFSEDPVVFATHALSPAKISRVTILDPVEKHMEVIVDDTQLSLAIGKKGQNVRLAAKLLNWKIDIKSEEEKRQEVESQMAALVVPGAPVSALLEHGLNELTVEKLVEAGIGTVEKLGSMTPEQLEEVPEIGGEMVEQIQMAVNSYYSQFETGDTPVEEEVVPESGSWPDEQRLDPGTEAGSVEAAETQPLEASGAESVEVAESEVPAAEQPAVEAAEVAEAAATEEAPDGGKGEEPVQEESGAASDEPAEAVESGRIGKTD